MNIWVVQKYASFICKKYTSQIYVRHRRYHKPHLKKAKNFASKINAIRNTSTSSNILELILNGNKFTQIKQICLAQSTNVPLKT